MFVLLYLGVIILFFAALLFATFGKSGWDYFSIDAVVANLNNNFLIGLYVVLPAVFVFLFTIATRQHHYAQYNWWIAVGIALCRIVIIAITSRSSLVNKYWWLLMTALSIALAYVVCLVVVHDHSSYSAINANMLVLVMWLVSVLTIAKLLGEAKFGNLDEDENYRNNILRLYKRYCVEFDAIIGPYFKKDPVAYRLLFAIMIAEDINRPGIVRLLERMLFPFSKVATTGIMQVTASEYLSNGKSVTLAQEIILGSYKEHKNEFRDDYPLIRAVASDYNGGVYPELIADIYYNLKEKDYTYKTKAV